MGKYIVILILLFVITSTVTGLYIVSSPSMEDTLLVGDRFVTLAFWYGLRLPLTETVVIHGADPVHGDILTFSYPIDPSQTLVKRCVAVGGQTVKISEKRLFVDETEVTLPPRGKHADPNTIPGGPYGSGKRDFLAAVTVPDTSIFVMGDNRDFSVDSRLWGPLPKRCLRGKAWIILFSIDPEVPWKDVGRKIRWGRCGMRIE